MNFLFDVSQRPRNISELAKVGDFTLSLTSTLISRWSKEGVVLKSKKEGAKEIIITLTEYGEKQVKLLKELNLNHKQNKQTLNDEQIKAINLVKNDTKNGTKEVNNGVRRN